MPLARLLILVSLFVGSARFAIGDDVASARRAKAAIARYEKLKGRLGAGLAQEVQLARWCEKRDLDTQAQTHWLRALCFDAKNPRALNALGLQSLFEPSAAEPGTAARQLAALRLLAELDEPAANFLLVWHALNSADGAIRDAAYAELSKKPQEHYVPILLSAMSMPIELGVQTQLLGNRVINHYSVEREGPNDTVSQANFSVSQVIRASKNVATLQKETSRRFVPERTEETSCGTLRVVPAHFDTTTLGFNVLYSMNPNFVAQLSSLSRGASQQAMVAREQVAQLNRTIAQRNEQIAALLRQSTDREFDGYPRNWWKWWEDYHKQRSTKFISSR